MVSEEKQNPYFDIDLKYSPSCKAKVRVMSNEQYSREMFVKYQEESTPIQMERLSPIKSGKQFFNPKLGAQMSPVKALDFTASDSCDVSILDVMNSPPSGVFSVKGEIRWSDYIRSVSVRGYQKQLREGNFIDASAKQIKITVWETNNYTISSINESTTYHITNVCVSWYNGQMRLSTTIKTEITPVEKESFDWSKNPALSSHTRICCPTVVSAKPQCYVRCPINDCRKKIDVIKVDAKEVTCDHCGNIMLLKRCAVTYSIDVIVEKNTKQLKLTAFPECLKEFFKNSGGDTNLKQYVSAFIETENVDIHFDKKRIITKIEHHPEDLI